MITTRARPGSGGGVSGRAVSGELGASGERTVSGERGVSVIPLDLLEQVAEAGRGKAGRRAFEAFHRPGPEVEVDRAHRVLNRTPQGPPVPADEAEQPGPGDPAGPRPRSEEHT